MTSSRCIVSIPRGAVKRIKQVRRPKSKGLFQFQEVQLKGGHWCKVLRIYWFQFQEVQLKVDTFPCSQTSFYPFQFQEVQLKELRPLATASAI